MNDNSKQPTKNRPLKIAYTVFFALIAILISYKIVYGATIFQNLDKDLNLSFAGASSPFLYIGTGHNFTPTGLRVGGDTNSGTVGISLLADFYCSNAPYPSFSPCGTISADTEVIPQTTNGIIQFNYTAAPALDPSKYYYISVNLASSTGRIWGSTNTDPNGFNHPCFGGVSCSVTNGYNSLYYQIAGTGGFDPSATNTRIDSVVPENNATVATGTVMLSASGYINNADFDDNTRISFRIRNNYSAYNAIRGVSVFTIVQSIDLSGATSTGNVNVDYTIDFTPSGPGDFTVSTTTNMQVIGDRRFDVSIHNPRFSIFNFNFGRNTVVSTSTRFTVATSTVEDNIVQQAAEGLITLFQPNDSSCDQFITGSSTLSTTNVPTFIRCLFTPTTLGMGVTISALKNEILSRWPIGYATRALAILNSAATTSLPTGSWISPNTLGELGNYEVEIDPWTVMRDEEKNPFYWDDINWGGNSSSTQGQNLWELVEPIYTPIVYAFYLFALISFIIWRRN